jgi:transcriptional regulator with XRE-family HTH domain
MRDETMSREKFGEYVERVMRQKGLKAVNVERNSGGMIDRSHVSKIISGVETNPSAKAMLALAKGLKVDPHDVFTAVTGYPPGEGRSNAPDMLEVLSVIERVATDPELMETLRGLIRLSKEGRASFTRSLSFCDEEHQLAKQRGRREKKKRQS